MVQWVLNSVRQRKWDIWYKYLQYRSMLYGVPSTYKGIRILLLTTIRNFLKITHDAILMTTNSVTWTCNKHFADAFITLKNENHYYNNHYHYGDLLMRGNTETSNWVNKFKIRLIFYLSKASSNSYKLNWFTKIKHISYDHFNKDNRRLVRLT